MRAMICLAVIVAAGIGAPAAAADIYTWVDEDGIRHISNLSPPPHAQVFLKTEDPPTDDIRIPRETERQAELLRAQEEIRRREERLARQAAALERRLEETAQLTRQALEKAEDRLAAAEARSAEAWRDHRYGMAFTYINPPFGHRHAPHKHRRHHAGRDDQAASLEGRPFHLGAVHLPLFNARDFFRRPPDVHERFGVARHPEGGHGPSYRSWKH